MARFSWHGTPAAARSTQLVTPARSRMVMATLVAAGLTLIVTLGTHATGYKRVLSPGPLASHHANIEQTCAACHDDSTDRQNLKCERCHDTAGEMRLTHPAHVMLGTGDRRLAAGSPELSCWDCHREHQGRTAAVARVDDGECAVCHTNVAGFASHPEFSIVKAGRTPGVGVEFNHQKHLAAVQKDSGRSCEACHEPTPERRTFRPITFERHCVDCHVTDLAKPGPGLDAALLLSPDQVRAAGFSTGVEFAEAPMDRVRASGAIHREPWIQINMLRLRAIADPDGHALELAAVAERLAYTNRLNALRPLGTASVPDLQAAIAALATDVQALEEQRARADATVTADTAVLVSHLDALAAQFSGISPELDAVLASPRPDATGSADAASGNADSPVLARRKAELQAVLTALATRAAALNNAGFSGRVQSLQQRLDAFVLPAGADTTSATVANAQLVGLEDVVRALLAVPGPSQNDDAVALAFAVRAARHQILGGLPLEGFEEARRNLLALLDVMATRSKGAAGTRIAELRRKVATLTPGAVDPAELSDQIAERRRQMARLQVELDLRALADVVAPVAAPTTPTPDAARVTRQSDAELFRILQVAGQTPAPVVPAEEARALLSRLAGAVGESPTVCAKCHEFGAGGVRFAAVRIAEPVHARASFSHAPHLSIATCASCHQGIAISTRASDPNVPGVASCQSCHGAGRAPATCATCHRYHAKPYAGIRP